LKKRVFGHGRSIKRARSEWKCINLTVSTRFLTMEILRHGRSAKPARGERKAAVSTRFLTTEVFGCGRNVKHMRGEWRSIKGARDERCMKRARGKWRCSKDQGRGRSPCVQRVGGPSLEAR
jgi:hypothetical protein